VKLNTGALDVVQSNPLVLRVQLVNA